MNASPAVLDKLVALVRRAGDEVLAVYESDFRVDVKADRSPVTAADLRAHDVIAAGLERIAPDIPVVSEESAPPPFEARSQWPRFWLVDPLDGTKEFVNRNGDFTVNIALIESGKPALGVVGVPARGRIYAGGADGGYCLDSGGRTPLKTRRMRDEAITVVASRSHRDERLTQYLSALEQRFATVSATSVGSSLKFCLLAAGEADFYPRLSPTAEWDTAAAHAVLRAAGGDVRRWDGRSLAYGTKASLLNPEFYAVGDGAYPWREKLPPLPGKKL